MIYVAKNINGLSNRIKCMVSVLALSDKAVVKWPTNNKVRCKYSYIFSYPKQFKGTAEKVVVYGGWRFIVRKKDLVSRNSGIDLLYHKTPVIESKILLSAFSKIKFSKYINEKVSQFRLPPDSIGVNIRSWKENGKKSNLRKKKFDINKYYEKIDNYSNDRKIFLTSDNNESIKLFKRRYGKRILTTKKRTSFGDRSTVNGIVDSVIDMFISSKCSLIIGSNMSTYTEVAWWFGGAKAEVDLVTC